MTELDLTSRESVFASLPRGLIIAEVGVASGHFSRRILELARPLVLYLIDCWQTQPKEVDPATIPQEDHDARFKLVSEMFADDSRVIVWRAYSVDAARDCDDGCLDVVYLDANHTAVREDVAAWWPKVRPGCWLMGHDYVFHEGYFNVKPEVDAWAASEGLTLQVAAVGSNVDYPTWIVQKPC